MHFWFTFGVGVKLLAIKPHDFLSIVRGNVPEGPRKTFCSLSDPALVHGFAGRASVHLARVIVDYAPFAVNLNQVFEFPVTDKT